MTSCDDERRFFEVSRNIGIYVWGAPSQNYGDSNFYV